MSDFAVILEMLSNSQEIRGKVRIQKLIFLAQLCMQNHHNFGFKPAPLGPLSDHVNTVMEYMTEIGMMEEIIKTTQFGNVVFCYKITDTGTDFLESTRHRKVLSKQDVQAINDVYKQYGNMNYGELLDFVHKKYPEYHLKDVAL